MYLLFLYLFVYTVWFAKFGGFGGLTFVCCLV